MENILIVERCGLMTTSEEVSFPCVGDKVIIYELKKVASPEQNKR